jgi:bacterioferritin
VSEIDKKRVIDLLNRILESELAGVIRYTHYSFLVYGYTRIPIVSWLRDQATESLTHAQLAGEMITQLGAYPSLGIGRLLDSHQHDIGKILVEVRWSTRQLHFPPLQRAAISCRGPLGYA